MDRKKTTLGEILTKAARGERLTMLTAVDYPTGLLADRAGVDLILVGDSLGMTALGYETTVPVTMADMLHHCRAVMRGVRGAFVVGDLPFGSYHTSVEGALENAVRMVKDGGADCVKLEGGAKMADVIRAIVDAGIPVCGHIGLTPQTSTMLGGMKAQGRDIAAARRVIEDALAVESAGAFAVVIEAVPDKLAALISERLTIPTIGIGAGAGCDGQVLVTHDLLGLFDRFTPKFAKRYAEVGKLIEETMVAWRRDVEAGAFPAAEHTFSIKAEVIEDLRREG